MWATIVEECNFLTLFRRADKLFHGRCTAKQEFPGAEPVPYTEYTFEVLEAVKGCRDAQEKPLKSVTFRHAGTRRGRALPDGTEAAPLRLGVSTYEVGDEVVLFLTRESRLGLCAPVGLYQGKFHVAEKDGKKRLRNCLGNHKLFDGVDPSSFPDLRKGELEAARSSGEDLELSAFLDLCRKVEK